jgi:hypothetical protein
VLSIVAVLIAAVLLEQRDATRCLLAPRRGAPNARRADDGVRPPATARRARGDLASRDLRGVRVAEGRGEEGARHDPPRSTRPSAGLLGYLGVVIGGGVLATATLRHAMLENSLKNTTAILAPILAGLASMALPK